MAKHTHKDIGEQFSTEINLLSRQPNADVWANIEKQLDKADAKNYKDKFTRLRKRTTLLLLLLIGISTFSVIFINTYENRNIVPGLSVKQRGQVNNDKAGSSVINKHDAAVINDSKQNRIGGIAVFSHSTINNKRIGLFSPDKLSVIEKEITIFKAFNDSLNEDEPDTDIKAGTRKIISPEKINEDGITDISISATDPQKPILEITRAVKKDSSVITVNGESVKADKKKQQNHISKFTVTAFAAPGYSAYRLENDEANNHDNKTGIAKRENSDVSSSIGILLGYKIGYKIDIQSGITYSSSDISIDPTRIYAEKDKTGIIKFRYNTSSGYGYLLPSFSNSPAIGDSLFADGANHTLHYISIPVIAKYRIGNKKITFNPGMGIVFNFLTKATLTTDIAGQLNRETEYISKLEGIKKFGTSLMLIAEVQYQLSKNWSISAMPYFKYSLGAINKSNVVKTYPYTVGLGIGVVYQF